MPGIAAFGVLGLSLSVDAFAAAVGKGATGARPRLVDALRIGALFGLFEAIAPAVGWMLGVALAGWITEVDHWVAFALLAGVGSHMLWEAFKGEAPDEPDRAPKPHSQARLVLTALATSIDATAVGISLAFLDANILVACLVIGAVTTIVATTGVLIGRRAGTWLGRYAELIGGIALIAIGSLVLHQHLTAPVL
jgi:putative Mn2+ efflux pump MntP